MPLISLREILGYELFNKFVVESKYTIFYKLKDPSKYVIRMKPKEYEVISIYKDKSDIITEPLDISALRHMVEGLVE